MAAVLVRVARKAIQEALAFSCQKLLACELVHEVGPTGQQVCGLPQFHTEAALHCEANNAGPSLLAEFGSFEGGAFKVCLAIGEE